MTWKLTRKHNPPYTQAEIKEQQVIVMEAINQRDAVNPKSEDYTRASTSVECAQEILNFMLEAVSRFNHG